DAANVFPPRAGARSRRLVLLVDPASPLPQLALALLAGGEASLVSEGFFTADAEAEVDLGEGLTASVPVALADPPIFPRGRAGGKGALPDATVAARGAPDKPAAAPAGTFSGRPDERYAEPPYPPRELRLLALFRYWAAVHYLYAYLPLIGD